MHTRNRRTRRMLAWALLALLFTQPLAAMASALAQPAEGEILYYARATLALKLRVAPEKTARGVDSIPKGATVYILDLTDDDWAHVVTDRADGYVQRKYLENVKDYVPNAAAPSEAQEAEPTGAFVADTQHFREAYQAYAAMSASMRDSPSESGHRIATIPTYKQVIVSETDGEWCYARYKNSYGYIDCDALFKWDRLLADAGPIPNMDILPLMIFVKRSTNIYATKDNSVLKTINPGAAIAAFEKDNQGRYVLPYWRTTGYINEEDVAYVWPVAKDSLTAQPGELVSVMSTYYALGISTLQFQGRNWNIHLASSLINGYILQPGESYNQYEVIGPYRKSTGYHSAPIMKTGVLSGYGGGTCQVNTTFYIANMQVPILVTHRKVHADVGTYYAPKGQDAAVGGGDINLTLINTLPYPIRYQFFDSDGVLTCCIFRES